MKKILIFDLDGTLVDSLADIHHALNGALADCDLPLHTQDSVRRMIGHGLSELIGKAIPENQLSPDMHARVLDRMKVRYEADPFTRTLPYFGIEALLKELKHSGRYLAVLTNKSHAIANRIVQHFFPGIFDSIQGEMPGRPRKPDPEAVLGLLRAKMTITPHEQASLESLISDSVLIGDSEADMQSAISAGVKALGVNWGFRSSAELFAAGAPEVVSSAEELRKALQV